MGINVEEKIEMTKKSFVCINCDHPIQELYTKYSSSVLKITKCDNCHKIADKYIEFEPIVIVIDLVLLSRPAYRHVLYNSDFKVFWKLNLIIWLLDAYISWSNKSNLYAQQNDPFTKEKLFYFCFLLALIDNLMLMGFLLYSLRGSKIEKTSKTRKDRILLLLKSMCLGSVSKMFLLPIVIWSSLQNEFVVKLNFLLVMGYYLCGLVHVHSVISGYNRVYSTFVVVFSLIVKSVVFNVIVNKLEQNNFYI